MTIQTYTDRIEINRYDKMTFDYQRATVSFITEGHARRLYFDSITHAREFILGIMEALYERRDEIDLSHIMYITECYDIGSLISLIQDRIDNFKPYDDK